MQERSIFVPYKGELLQGMLTLAASAIVPGLGPDIPANATPTFFQLGVLYFSLYIVAVGTGGIKPNVSAFGADQFDDNSRSERKEKQSFFNWFYLVINVGSLLACTIIIWIQVHFISEGLCGCLWAVCCSCGCCMLFYRGNRTFAPRSFLCLFACLVTCLLVCLVAFLLVCILLVCFFSLTYSSYSPDFFKYSSNIIVDFGTQTHYS
jgi:dipeptide/tripeptide permease